MAIIEPARYCPRCGAPIEAEAIEAEAIAAAAESGAAPSSGPLARCGDAGCGYVQYRDPKVATGVVATIEGRILLVRRNHDPALGRWSFPSGYVDAGEVVEAAAVREVREETGVEVRIDRLLGVYSAPGEDVIFVAYAGEVVGGEPAPGDEAFEVALFDPDDLPALPFPHDGAIIEAWRAAGQDGGAREG